MQWLISLCLYKISDVLLSKNLYSAFSFDSVFNDNRMQSRRKTTLLFFGTEVSSRYRDENMPVLSPVHVSGARWSFSVLSMMWKHAGCWKQEQQFYHYISYKITESQNYGCRIGASAWINWHCINFYPKRNSGCPCHKLTFEWPSDLQVLFWIQLFKLCSP